MKLEKALFQMKMSSKWLTFGQVSDDNNVFLIRDDNTSRFFSGDNKGLGPLEFTPSQETLSTIPFRLLEPLG